MKLNVFLLSLTLLIGITSMPFAEEVQGQAQEQEAVAETQEGEMDAAMKAMMEKFSDYSIPGEQHQVLSPLIGTWKQKVKYWMSPNDEAQESFGTSHNTWILDGRFVQQISNGESMGQPFEGMGIIGFDNLSSEISLHC